LEDSITIVLDNRDLLSGVCGANDGNLRLIEGFLGGRIAARGNEIRLEGAGQAGVRRFKRMMDSLIAAVEEGDNPSPDYVKALMGNFILPGETEKDPGEGSALPSSLPAATPSAMPLESPAGHANGARGGAAAGMAEAMIRIPQGFSRVFPRSRNQAAYVLGMRSCDISFGIGPAGTGKTFLAIAESLSLVLSKKMRKLVLTRPVVEAGENLGFLPGDLAQKISPYLRPLYDAMESLAPFEIIRRLEETRAIEIAPLAYMRGRSLNDCVVVLDEAQNTTKEQMKMFLTRIGQGARAVITGDITQIDLPRRIDSGLLHAVSVLSGVEGIHFSFLHTADVVRNPLVKKIIEAYERENQS
jgi:phosphate starvation-inducible PhoH-like protein